MSLLDHLPHPSVANIPTFDLLQHLCKGGETNRQRLMDELADVQAQIGCAVLTFGLDQEYMARRTAEKMRQMGNSDKLEQYHVAPERAEDLHAEHWAAIAECGAAIAASHEVTAEQCMAFCAALDRLSAALMGEAQASRQGGADE